MLVCLPPFYNKWTQTSHLKVLSLKILDSFWLTRLRLAGTSQRGWTAMRLTSTLIRTWAERMRWTQLGVFITVLLASSLFIQSFTNKHTCHTHVLFWNGVFLNWSTWLIEKFHFCITILQRAASAVLLRGQKAASCCISPSLLPPQAPESSTQGLKDAASPAHYFSLSLWRECSRRKTGKRWGRGRRKNGNTQSTRTHPGNRRCLHVSGRMPEGRATVAEWVITRQQQTYSVKEIQKSASCQAASAKKDSNGLCESTACLISATSRDWISDSLKLFTVFTCLWY